jgi:hypothetical protein
MEGQGTSTAVVWPLLFMLQVCTHILKKKEHSSFMPGMVAQACNLNTHEAEAGRLHKTKVSQTLPQKEGKEGRREEGRRREKKGIRKFSLSLSIFQVKVSLYRPGCPGICSVDQAGLIQ